MRVTALLLLLAAGAAFAQNPTVSGRITDSSGGVIPGARVQLTNAATAVATAAQSNAEGYYVLPPVRPGRYTITASAPGFKEARIEGFPLEIAQARTMNVQFARRGEGVDHYHRCRSAADGVEGGPGFGGGE